MFRAALASSTDCCAVNTGGPPATWIYLHCKLKFCANPLDEFGQIETALCKSTRLCHFARDFPFVGRFCASGIRMCTHGARRRRHKTTEAKMASIRFSREVSEHFRCVYLFYDSIMVMGVMHKVHKHDILNRIIGFCALFAFRWSLLVCMPMDGILRQHQHMKAFVFNFHFSENKTKNL